MTRQEMRATVRSTKTAEAAIKQIETRERQVEKEKMKAGKQIVMQEVAQELQMMRQGYEQAIETQRRDFVVELERVNGRLHEAEWEAATLKNEVAILKPQRTNSNQRSIPSASNSPTASPNPSVTETLKSTRPVTKSYDQIAASSSMKSARKNDRTEVTSRKQRQKSTVSNLPKLEPGKKRVIFHREFTSPGGSEADLMLVLNEALQKAGIPAYTRFSRVGYLQSGANSALLTEKSNAENLVRDHSNMHLSSKISGWKSNWY